MPRPRIQNSSNLNFREKAKRLKMQKVIQKKKIKTRYFKTIRKEGLQSLPEFYKEIFKNQNGEENDNDHNDHIAKSESGKESNVSNQVNIRTDVSLENIEDQNTSSRLKDQVRDRKRKKPNPLKKAFKETEQFRREKQARIEAKNRDREVQKQNREVYYEKRVQAKKKLLKKTAKGQPLMKNQIAHLLAKIQSTDSKERGENIELLSTQH